MLELPQRAKAKCHEYRRLTVIISSSPSMTLQQRCEYVIITFNIVLFHAIMFEHGIANTLSCHNTIYVHLYIYNILPRFCFLFSEYANEEAALFVRFERVRDDDVVAWLQQQSSRDLTEVCSRCDVGAADERA